MTQTLPSKLCSAQRFQRTSNGIEARVSAVSGTTAVGLGGHNVEAVLDWMQGEINQNKSRQGVSLQPWLFFKRTLHTIDLGTGASPQSFDARVNS